MWYIVKPVFCINDLTNSQVYYKGWDLVGDCKQILETEELKESIKFNSFEEANEELSNIENSKYVGNYKQDWVIANLENILLL